MTKKDYEKIAKAIRETRDLEIECGRTPDVDVVALKLARTLKEDNPRFNPSTFLKACGVKE